MIVVPVEISAFALSESKERPIHCFHLLKELTPGYTYLNKRQISNLSAYLKRNDRTVRRYLQYLESIGWIAPNGKVYTVKSWKRVFQIMGFEYVSGVECNITKVEDPQAFYAGIVLGRLSNFQRYKRNGSDKEKSAILSQCAPNQSIRSKFFPIADRALAQILDISPSKANKIKKQAYKQGYIDLKYNFYPYQLNGKPLKVTAINKPLFKKIFDDVGHKMRIDKTGRVSIQDSDLIRAKLRYKKSWNYL